MSRKKVGRLSRSQGKAISMLKAGRFSIWIFFCRNSREQCFSLGKGVVWRKGLSHPSCGQVPGMVRQTDHYINSFLILLFLNIVISILMTSATISFPVIKKS